MDTDLYWEEEVASSGFNYFFDYVIYKLKEKNSLVGEKEIVEQTLEKLYAKLNLTTDPEKKKLYDLLFDPREYSKKYSKKASFCLANRMISSLEEIVGDANFAENVALHVINGKSRSQYKLEIQTNQLDTVGRIARRVNMFFTEKLSGVLLKTYMVFTKNKYEFLLNVVKKALKDIFPSVNLEIEFHKKHAKLNYSYNDDSKMKYHSVGIENSFIRQVQHTPLVVGLPSFKAKLIKSITRGDDKTVVRMDYVERGRDTIEGLLLKIEEQKAAKQVIEEKNRENELLVKELSDSSTYIIAGKIARAFAYSNQYELFLCAGNFDAAKNSLKEAQSMFQEAVTDYVSVDKAYTDVRKTDFDFERILGDFVAVSAQAKLAGATVSSLKMKKVRGSNKAVIIERRTDPLQIEGERSWIKDYRKFDRGEDENNVINYLKRNFSDDPILKFPSFHLFIRLERNPAMGIKEDKALALTTERNESEVDTLYDEVLDAANAEERFSLLEKKVDLIARCAAVGPWHIVREGKTLLLEEDYFNFLRSEFDGIDISSIFAYLEPVVSALSKYPIRGYFRDNNLGNFYNDEMFDFDTALITTPLADHAKFLNHVRLSEDRERSRAFKEKFLDDVLKAYNREAKDLLHKKLVQVDLKSLLLKKIDVYSRRLYLGSDAMSDAVKALQSYPFSSIRGGIEILKGELESGSRLEPYLEGIIEDIEEAKFIFYNETIFTSCLAKIPYHLNLYGKGVSEWIEDAADAVDQIGQERFEEYRKKYYPGGDKASSKKLCGLKKRLESLENDLSK